MASKNTKVGRQPVTDCNRLGNAAKMREALEAVVTVGYPHNFQNEAYHIREYCYEITTAIKKCFAALYSPPRNCDRPECATTKEAQDVWSKEDGGKTAYYEWLLATSTNK